MPVHLGDHLVQVFVGGCAVRDEDRLKSGQERNSGRTGTLGGYVRNSLPAPERRLLYFDAHGSVQSIPLEHGSMFGKRGVTGGDLDGRAGCGFTNRGSTGEWFADCEEEELGMARNIPLAAYSEDAMFEHLFERNRDQRDFVFVDAVDDFVINCTMNRLGVNEA